MSRPRGFSRGGGRGGGSRGGFRRDAGPPDQVFEVGSFVHAVEDEMLCCSILPDKIPSFNAPIYLQNKSVIGLVDEILGPINEVYFSIKMGEGMVASSFKKGDKVYIGGDRLMPVERFLPKPKITGGVTKRGRGMKGVAGAARGGRGRGFPRGGHGRGRGTSRGGFSFDRGRGRGGFGSNRSGARGWGGRGRGS